jgi:PBP1b-binding outer membrane lipoprotein LpoB
MKWLRYLFLLAVLTAVGCSSAPAPEQMVEDAPATEVDAAAEADALAR